MERRKRHENIMLIVANHLARYMDDDMPNHARAEFELVVAHRRPTPFMLAGLTDKLHDMTRPKKAQEILDIRRRFLTDAVFNSRTRCIVADIEQMLDNQYQNPELLEG